MTPDERDALVAQLPDGMKNCTIVLRECDKGHAWLTATNWVQHDCPTCIIDALEAERDEARRASIGAWLIVCVVLPLCALAIIIGSEIGSK